MKKMIQLTIIYLIIFLLSNLFAGEIRDKLGIGFSINSQKLIGDTYTGSFGYGVSPLILRYNFKPFVFLESDFGYQQIPTDAAGVELNSEMLNLGMKFGFRFLAEKKINPTLAIGLGFISFQKSNGSGTLAGYGTVGAGIEFFINDFLGLNITGDYRYSSNDDFDGGNTSNGKDGFLNIGFGINYYLGSRTRFLGSPELVENIPEQESPFEEISASGVEEIDLVQTVSSKSEPETEIVSEQKDRLLKSIEEKEEILNLLRVKLNSVDEHTKMLEGKLSNAGIDPSSHTGKDVDNLLIKRFRGGLKYFAAELYDDAAFTFKSILHEFPNNIFASNCWYWIGESYYNKQDYDAAIEAFEAALEKAPDSFKLETSKMMLGLSFWKAGHYLKAKSEFKNLMQYNPQSAFKPLLEDYLAKFESESSLPQ